MSIEGRQEGFNFCQNGIYRGKGLDLEKEPSCIKPPSGSMIVLVSTELLHMKGCFKDNRELKI